VSPLQQHFSEHGWVVQRGVLDAARVAALTQALDAVLPPDTWPAWGERVVEAAGVSRVAPLLAAHLHEAAFAALAAELLGAARVQLLQDTALIKPPHHPGAVAWHRDWGYVGFLDRPQVLTVRLALTPCTLASGCMRVLSGSHRWDAGDSNLALRRNSIEDELQQLPAPLRERAETSEVALELAPGDISVHHCQLFHGSAPNGSDAPRKTLAARLFDGACRLRPERLPSPEMAAHFPTDASGHLAAEPFPVLWPPAV